MDWGDDNGGDGSFEAFHALKNISEGILGRRLGFTEALDPDETSFEDVFGYTPGDQD